VFSRNNQSRQNHISQHNFYNSNFKFWLPRIDVISLFLFRWGGGGSGGRKWTWISLYSILHVHPYRNNFGAFWVRQQKKEIYIFFKIFVVFVYKEKATSKFRIFVYLS
jgi:hypothetical protein